MSSSLDRAVSHLHAGGLVTFPTETVYGLGGDANNPEATRRIFELKGRPADHPLIVHLAAAGQLSDWATNIPSVAWQLAEAFWPGPLTLVLAPTAGIKQVVPGG